MAEISNGVKILLGRMASHPEDFYGDALQWRFMFAEKFRDVLTEPEKGMIHEALKELRRGEFDGLVVQAILRDEEEKKKAEEEAAEAMRAREKALAKQTKQNYQAMNQQAGMGHSYTNPLQNIFK
jgi:predicted aminopeptidase